MKKPIIISGPAASGKSSLGKHLSERFGIEFYDGGDVLKMLARERGYRPAGKDWWDTEEGMNFLAERHRDAHFDKAVDAKFLDVLKQGSCVITSWTMPWLFKGAAIRVWIFATAGERAKRLALRDGIDEKKSLEILRERDTSNIALYKRLYGIDFGKDLEPFDIVLNTSGMTLKEVFNEIEKRVKEKL